MQWIEHTQIDTKLEHKFLTELDAITIYHHNSVLTKNKEKLSFTCVFNMKRLTRQLSIIGKVKGDCLARNVSIFCSLTSLNKVIVGRTQHQKMELMRFAASYNNRCHENSDETELHQVKVNPINGQFYINCNLFLREDLLKDCKRFKQKMTHMCEELGNEAERVFNTIISMIFEQQSNEPYLQFYVSIGLRSQYPVRLENLLKKIKQFSMIAPHYKIKQDIASQSKHRSYFNKVYLIKTERTIHNPMIIDNALAHCPKFSMKHLEAIQPNASESKKNQQLIQQFKKLEDNLEIEVARHLHDLTNLQNSTKPLILLKDNESSLEHLKNPGHHQINTHTSKLEVYSEEIDLQTIKHQHQILLKLGQIKHPNIIQYYCFIKDAPVRLTEFFDCVSLEFYLSQNQETISLLTRLDIMGQICHLLTYLHSHSVGYFIDIRDIFITSNNRIKVKNFSQAYFVTCWDQNKPETHQSKEEVMTNKQDYRQIVGSDENRIEDSLQHEKSDVYALGMVLYRVLMDKFPFGLNSVHLLYELGEQKIQQFFTRVWTLQTQSFLRQGGTIVKLLAYVLLKCFHLDVKKRPYVQWLTVIICETKSSLDSLYA